jgi:pyrroloquinoline-quinone synthase
MAEPLDRDAFVAALRAQAPRYHDRHPFHVLMNQGRLGPPQLRTWVANRFYYQSVIPIKDAAILSNCPYPHVRRRWVQRLLDHDGHGDRPGGIESWLRLAEAVGLRREDVLDGHLVLPAVRFAADAYVSFARTRPWIEAVASSLTELFAPDLMSERIAAFERHYPWVEPEGLEYFRSRLTLAPRDAAHAIDLVTTYCTTREQQEGAIRALAFKCDVLWSMLEAIHHGCMDETPAWSR